MDLRYLTMSIKVHATSLHVLVTRLDILLPVKVSENWLIKLIYSALTACSRELICTTFNVSLCILHL